jgi:hypothetical protein
MCFICLNACLIYRIKYEIVIPRSSACPTRMGALQFGIRALQYERVLQFGIRAKVSTLSLDGPVEWSLDRGFEEKLCLEDQFRPLNAPECQGVT